MSKKKRSRSSMTRLNKREGRKEGRWGKGWDEASSWQMLIVSFCVCVCVCVSVSYVFMGDPYRRIGCWGAQDRLQTRPIWKLEMKFWRWMESRWKVPLTRKSYHTFIRYRHPAAFEAWMHLYYPFIIQSLVWKWRMGWGFMETRDRMR